MFKGKPKSDKHKKALKEVKSRENKEIRAKINDDNRQGKPQPKDFVKNMKINYRGVFGGRQGTRKDLSDQYFRSTWEANYARILTLLNIDYDFEIESFYIELSNKTSTYTPDFYLPSKNKYIEIKGVWIDDVKEKFDASKEQYPDIKIEVIDGKKYKRLEKMFKHRIEHWE